MPLRPVDDPSPFSLSGPVGHLAENARADVIKAQMLLAEAGYLDLPEPGLPTGWPGSGLVPGIRRLQRDSGVAADGILLPLGADGRVGPNGEGETMAALRDAVGDRMGPAPTPDEIDRQHDEEARRGDAPDRAAPPPVMRDVPDDAEPAFRAGAQVAQITAPLTGIPVPPPAGQAGHDGTRRPSPYPHEAPAVKAAAREGTRRIGYARDNLRSLLEATQDLHEQGRRLPPGPDDAQQAAFVTQDWEPLPPSKPIGEAEKKMMQVPPLIPPVLDDRLPGRPAAAPDIPDEKLIPPEMQEWIHQLPPLQQPFAEDFGGIILSIHNFGPRGSPETELATRIATRVCTEELAKRPTLANKLWHIAGSYNLETGDYVTEEWVPRRGLEGEVGSNRLKGGVYVGSSFGNTDKDSPYWARLQTVDVKKRGAEHDLDSLSKREGENYVRLGENIKQGVIGWARKMKSGESEEAYAKYVAVRCNAMWDDLEENLHTKGILPER